jgi:glycosyltransferase involved in cell wall biosynthesis
MKIIHIVNDLKIGGLQKFVCELSRESSLKYEVTLLVLNHCDKDRVYSVDSRVNVIFFSEKKYLSRMLRIKKVIKKYKPDIVHTHGLTLFLSILSQLRFCRSSLRRVHTVHNMAEKEAGKIRSYFHWFSFKFLGVTPITISNEVDNSFSEYYKGIARFQINNGINEVSKTNKFEKVVRHLNEIKNDEETKIIINVGRIDGQKNQKLLIEAFNKIKESNNVILLIAGSGDNENNNFYKNIVDSYDLDKIHFLSEVDNISDYLYCSDIFCLSSKFEGLPIALLEAMSVGLTCVSTKAGGTSMVINERVGYLTEDFNSISLANSLKLALCSPLTKNGVKNDFLNNYTMKICFENYNSIYLKNNE